MSTEPEKPPIDEHVAVTIASLLEVLNLPQPRPITPRWIAAFSVLCAIYGLQRLLEAAQYQGAAVHDRLQDRLDKLFDQVGAHLDELRENVGPDE